MNFEKRLPIKLGKRRLFFIGYIVSKYFVLKNLTVEDDVSGKADNKFRSWMNNNVIEGGRKNFDVLYLLIILP